MAFDPRTYPPTPEQEAVRKKLEHRTKLFIDFNAADKSAIARLSDSDLAAWQAQFPKESPQFILAEQLWKYRLARRSAKFAAVVAIVSALVGAIGGYALRGSEVVANDCSKDKPKQDIPPPLPGKIGSQSNGLLNGGKP